MTGRSSAAKASSPSPRRCCNPASAMSRGYQGAPISHLMDVLADAQDILADLGVHFEASASEATAAATLAASVMYPIRGAVTFKSPVGTNVASDALANLASGGVTGGALIIVGEDYGEGSSIMQERSHAFAMKSQIWLLDPRPNLRTHRARRSRTASSCRRRRTRRSCWRCASAPATCTAASRTKDNQRPTMTLEEALENAAARYRPHRAAARLLPAREGEDREALAGRGGVHQGAQAQRGFVPGDIGDVGIILQGGMYNGVHARAAAARPRRRLGHQPRSPLRAERHLSAGDDEVVDFCRGKERGADGRGGAARLHRAGAVQRCCARRASRHQLSGKDLFPMAGEYTAQVMVEAIGAFLRQCDSRHAGAGRARLRTRRRPWKTKHARALAEVVPPRPPGFCTGCPERPIFAAMKLVEQELGPHHVAADIGCHLFSIMPPFNIGATTMGYGLGPASASAFNVKAAKRSDRRHGRRRLLAQRPAPRASATPCSTRRRRHRSSSTITIRRRPAARTSCRRAPPTASRSTRHPIAEAVKGMGVKWVRQIDRTYDVGRDARHAEGGADHRRRRGRRSSSPRRNACSTGSAARSRCSTRR